MKLIPSLKSLIKEGWTIKSVNEFLKPNEKPSKRDESKGTYRKMIEKILNDNESKLKDNGIDNVRGHWFYSGTENGHPLSYLNTHYGTAAYLMKYFNIPVGVSRETAIEVLDRMIRNNFDKLFLDKDSKEYSHIYELLGKSRGQGDVNEKAAEEYLKKTYGDIIESINIVSETGGELDKSGVDLVVKTKNGETWNYQVKPFKFYRIAEDGNAVIYGVSGRTTPNSKQNRWVFMAGNKALEVLSKNLREGQYQRDVMFLPATDIVSKSDNVKPWVPKEKNS
jgi:hypothetical protein